MSFTASKPISRQARRHQLRQRRARAMLLGAAIFAAIVLVSSFPIGTLLSQHSQLSDTAAQLSRLKAANHTLSVQAQRLAQPSTVANLARRDYGLVSPGQRAYEILPPASGSVSPPPGGGQEPLETSPVASGSTASAQRLGAGPATATSPSGGTTPLGVASSAGGVGTQPVATGNSGGLISRTLHTLEFWR